MNGPSVDGGGSPWRRGLARRPWFVALLCVVLVGPGLVSYVVVERQRPAQRAPEVWVPPVLTISPSPSASPSPSPPPSSVPTTRPTQRPTTAPSTSTPRPAPESPLPPVIHDGDGVTETGPVMSYLHVSVRAVFITIDDGGTRDERVVDLIRQTHLPVSAFLVRQAVDVDPAYWQRMAAAGAIVENHTISHPVLTSLGYADQRAQICGPQSSYAGLFGRRPTLFRPPYGRYNDTTLRAVSDCGLSATILWDVTYGGGVMRTWGDRGLRPGDIILLHFTPTLYDDLVRLIGILRDENLGVGRLESFLAPKPTPTPTPTRKPTPTPTRTATPRPTATPTHSPTPTPTRSPTPSPSPSLSPSPASS